MFYVTNTTTYALWKTMQLEINILMNILVIVIQLTFISNFKKIDKHHKIIRDHNVWEIGFQLAVDKCDQYHSHSDTT